MKSSSINYLSEVILNSLEGNVYILDKEFRFMYFNEAYVKNYVYSFNELPQLNEVSKVITSQKQFFISLTQNYQNAFEGREISIEPKKLKHKFTPIHDENGEISMILVQFYLPDDVKPFIVENSLYSESQYHEVINLISDIIFKTDEHWRWTFLNDSWNKILGYSNEESLGKPFYDFMHPEDAAQKEQLFDALIREKKPTSKHLARFITKTGEIKWIKASVTFISDTKGFVIGATGTLRDITRQKENAHIYELLSNNVKDLVCIHDLEGSLLYISPSIKQITGYEPQDLIGKKLSDYYHPDDSQLVDKELLPFAGTTSSYISYRFRNADGEYVWLETNSKVFFDDYDLTHRIITSSREINDRKRTEEILMTSLQKEKELNDLKSLFVNVASHEFRTPLSTIRSSTEIIQLIDQNQNPHINKHVNIIGSQIDRITSLMNEILIVGKIESNNLSCNKERVNVIELVKSCFEGQNALQKDGRTIEFKVTGTPTIAEIDPLHLNLILDNLVSNAFKYSRNRPNPILSLSFNEDSFEITIQDFGIGIPSEVQNKIFNSFYRASNVGRIEGTGLGLVIAKNLVRLNGGKLNFESKENKGSTFILHFSYL